MNTICFVTTCSKNRRQAILAQRHLERQGINYCFVYGHAPVNPVDPFVIFQNCPESYAQLAYKTYNIIKYFIEETDNDYMFKIDEDTFTDFRALPEQVYRYDYGGTINYYEVRKGNKVPWRNFKLTEYSTDKSYFNLPNVSTADYATGGFYFLSRKAAEHILSFPEEGFINTPETYTSEDVKVGTLIATNKDLKVLDMTVKSSLNLEISTGYSSVHPTNPFIFPKLYNCKTIDERHTLLEQYDFLNTYHKINDHIEFT